ncbi:STAS domain-containing protein [Saccharococcus caldoxylosilyticus]|jgi:anti-anti-sigma factor|uniref:STAS domain-containing protein n=1 Tax=Saccharococcus caldoxylosilyticus TaxID=81408 RepID=UPI00031BE54D|nr:STAS domain-containing protein [Parageobacillus caldoxylosilyticus]QXJ38526.1 Anti-sigma-B factor antagonist [Parageobacillus caldoxylosilyticus]
MNTKLFDVIHEEQSDRHVIHVKGELDLASAEQFRNIAEPLANDKTKTLVIYLKDLTYIDSTGIGIFVSLLKRRQQLQAPVLIENIPPKIQRLFDLTGVSRFFAAERETTKQKGQKANDERV